jgi:hypothetical protein
VISEALPVFLHPPYDEIASLESGQLHAAATHWPHLQQSGIVASIDGRRKKWALGLLVSGN